MNPGPADAYRHRFATIEPPTVNDAPICGAALARDWTGHGKPDCPACEQVYQRLHAEAETRRARATVQGAQ